MDTGINEALQKDSGLRLYAGGGTVQSQAGGNTGQNSGNLINEDDTRHSPKYADNWSA